MTEETQTLLTSKRKPILIGIIVAIVWWLVEAGVDAFVFKVGTFAERVFPSDPNELWMRGIAVCLIVGFGIYAERVIRKLQRMGEILYASNQQLRATEQQLKASNQQLDAGNQQLKASNQQLNASNQQLQAIQREMEALAKFPSENPNPVLRLSSEGIILYANKGSRGVLDTWGCGEGEQIPQSWRSRVKEAFASGKVGDFEFNCDDGRMFSVTLAPVVDAGYANLYGLDITERKQAEQQLQAASQQLDASNQQLIASNQQLNASNQQLHATEQQLKASNQQLDASNQQLKATNQQLNAGNQQLRATEDKLRTEHNLIRTLIDNLPDSIYVKDNQGRFILGNLTTALRTGVEKPEELLGKTDFDFYPQELAKQFSSDEEQIIQSGKPLLNREETIIDQTTGESLLSLTSKVPLRDTEGKVVGIVGIGRDITLWRQAEQQLQDANQQLDASNQQLQASIDQMPTAYILWEKDFRVLEWNRAAEEIFGYTKEEVLGEALGNLIVPEPARHLVDDVLEELRNGESSHYSEKDNNITKDGTLISCQWHNKPLVDGEGNVFAILSIAEDITERRQAEEQLKASLVEKELLLKEVHHRVKNNLQLMCSLIKLQVPQTKSKAAAKVLGEYETRIKTLSLVHDKLYQSGDLAHVNFSEFVSDLARGLYSSFDLRQDTIKLLLDTEEVSLQIDKAIPCGLILNELLTNSFKHAFPPGKTGEIRVNLETTDGNVQMAVGDNGVGLPAGFSFENAESLGLKLVNGLARQLEGQVTIDTKGGTSFTIVFPRE